MEFVPVVQVVQVNRVTRRWRIVSNCAGAKDAFACVVVVDVAANAAIEFVDGSLIRVITEPNQVTQPNEFKTYKGSGLPIYDEKSHVQRFGDLLVQFTTGNTVFDAVHICDVQKYASE